MDFSRHCHKLAYFTNKVCQRNATCKEIVSLKIVNFKKQRTFRVTLLRRTKKEYFQNLNVKDLSDNKHFWKTIKPHFSNKKFNLNKLLLQGKG